MSKKMTCGEFANALQNHLWDTGHHGISWCCANRDLGEDGFKYTENTLLEATWELTPIAFIRPGPNEGYMVTVAVLSALRGYDTICRVKVLTDKTEAWKITRACQEFLEATLVGLPYTQEVSS